MYNGARKSSPAVQMPVDCPDSPSSTVPTAYSASIRTHPATGGCTACCLPSVPARRSRSARWPRRSWRIWSTTDICPTGRTGLRTTAIRTALFAEWAIPSRTGRTEPRTPRCFANEHAQWAATTSIPQSTRRQQSPEQSPSTPNIPADSADADSIIERCERSQDDVGVFGRYFTWHHGQHVDGPVKCKSGWVRT
jgi:hypothetical protein